MPIGHYERKKKIVQWVPKDMLCPVCGKPKKSKVAKFCSIVCFNANRKGKRMAEKAIEDMPQFKEYITPQIPQVQIDQEFLTAPEKSFILSSLHRILIGLEKTLKEKNADYSGVEGEFWNFEAAAYLSGVPIEKGILNRMADKFCRLRNVLAATPLTKEESIDETITDLIGYAVILHAYRQQLSSFRMGHLAADEGEN